MIQFFDPDETITLTLDERTERRKGPTWVLLASSLPPERGKKGPSRWLPRAPLHRVHERGPPKGTTAVPLYGAAHGSSCTRALAKGATAAPPSPLPHPPWKRLLRRLWHAAKREKGREMNGLGFGENAGRRFCLVESHGEPSDPDGWLRAAELAFGLGGKRDSRPRPRLRPGHGGARAPRAKFASGPKNSMKSFSFIYF
jgi:hypothetical protein